jgi:hypothetical protein
MNFCIKSKTAFCIKSTFNLPMASSRKDGVSGPVPSYYCFGAFWSYIRKTFFTIHAWLLRDQNTPLRHVSCHRGPLGIWLIKFFSYVPNAWSKQGLALLEKMCTVDAHCQIFEKFKNRIRLFIQSEKMRECGNEASHNWTKCFTLLYENAKIGNSIFVSTLGCMHEKFHFISFHISICCAVTRLKSNVA